MERDKLKEAVGCFMAIVISTFILCVPLFFSAHNAVVRDLISIVSALLAFASFILMIVSIFRPVEAMFWFSNGGGRITRKRAFFTYFLLYVLFEVILVVSIPDKEIENGRTNHEKLHTEYYDSIYNVAYNYIDLKKKPIAELDSILKQVTVKVYLTKKISEEEVRSIGTYYHDMYLQEPYNKVYVFLFTPDFKNEDVGYYAIAHSEPELKVEILKRIDRDRLD